jgi:WW domain-containing oxidoreductase
MLFLNAAIFEPNHTLTDNGLEIMFQVNYLSQFYLTRLLLDNLINTPQSRIIVISCESHRYASLVEEVNFEDFLTYFRGSNLSRKDISLSKLNLPNSEFDLLQVYCNTKMCNILFSKELHRRLIKLSGGK